MATLVLYEGIYSEEDGPSDCDRRQSHCLGQSNGSPWLLLLILLKVAPEPALQCIRSNGGGGGRCWYPARVQTHLGSCAFAAQGLEQRGR